MPDIADITEARREAEESIRQYGNYEIPAGEAGECELCGEDHPRLIEGACPMCRDKRGLK